MVTINVKRLYTILISNPFRNNALVYYLSVILLSELLWLSGLDFKTTDFQPLCPRFESAGSDSSAIEQGTSSSLSSPSEKT